MQAVSPGWAAAIVRGHTIAARAFVLDAALQPIAKVDLLSMELVMDRSQSIRRSGRFSLRNVRGELTPYELDSLIQLGRPVRLEVGAYIGGGPEWKVAGTLFPDNPQTSTGSGALDLGGRDRLRLAAESDLTEPITYPDYFRVAEVIRAIAQDAGMGTDDALYSLDDGGRLLGVYSTYEAERNRLDLMTTIATDNGCEVFCAATGELVLRPLVDPATVDPVATFNRGDGARTLGVTRGWEDQVKNHVAVIGDRVRAEAEITDITSPLHKSKIGDRVYWYRSDGIVWHDQAQDLADKLLPQLATIAEQIQIEALPDPALEAGDVIELNDPKETRASGRFLLDYAPISGEAEATQLMVRRVVSAA